jgi:hypothetical protein
MLVNASLVGTSAAKDNNNSLAFDYLAVHKVGMCEYTKLTAIAVSICEVWHNFALT